MMLDTIALTLARRDFEIRDPARFSPSAAGLLHPPYYPLGGRANFNCVLNPTKADFEAGRYLPRLTLGRRKNVGGWSVTLRVEFSAPKLLFGNNFDELISRDFDAVVAALRAALAGMGVEIGDYALRAARVSAIHYSKNVALLDFTTCSMAMRELELIDLDGRLDLSHTDYRNDGHAIRYHANSFEVTFYDKLRDLEKARYSEKRALERDNRIQLGLFAARDAFPKQLEVLRMEVRLGDRRKIVGLLKRIGDEREPTFAALFDASLAQAVLQHFWRRIQSQLPIAAEATRMKPEDLLSALAAGADGAARPGALLQQLGAVVLVGSVGMRGAGALLSRHCSARSWQRYKRQLRALRLPESRGYTALRQVADALAAFRPLRLNALRRDDAVASPAATSQPSVEGGHRSRRCRPQHAPRGAQAAGPAPSGSAGEHG